MRVAKRSGWQVPRALVALLTLTSPLIHNAVAQDQSTTLTLIVETAGSDGTYTFSSPQAQVEVPVTTSGGTGQSGAIGLAPGTVTFAIDVPDGAALSAINCTAGDNSANLENKTLTIALQSDDNVICTIEVTGDRTSTARTITRSLSSRKSALAASRPRGERQISRLKAAAKRRLIRKGTSSAPRLGRKARAGSLSLRATNDVSAAFSASLGEIQEYVDVLEEQRIVRLIGEDKYRKLGASRYASGENAAPFDVWVQGQLSYFDVDGRSARTRGNFGVIKMGADYVVSSQVLLGFLAQVDNTDEAASDIQRRGWMVGPYGTIQLSPNLYLQGRAAWGRLANTVDPASAQSELVETERWLLGGKLQGDVSIGDWNFSPVASIDYSQERNDDYGAGSGVSIPGQTVSLGQASVGPELSYSLATRDGITVRPTLGVKGVWTFADEAGAAGDGATIDTKTFRGQTELGLKIVGDEGASLEFSGTHDGIGEEADDYSGSVKFRLPLN